ncbi:hypothetical protein HDV05_004752 [Chytridiales sp. JEL 0842]|nr:hypothetical protein HDV05_004752 [Chytridiales sp. JEL 0842]
MSISVQPIESINNLDGTQTYTFFEPTTSTWTYLVTDTSTSESILIDPVLDYDLPTGTITTQTADGILAFAEKERLKIVRVIETHAHADHLTSAWYVKSKLGAGGPLICIGEGIKKVQEVVKGKFALDDLKTDGSQFDILFKDGDTFQLGNTPCRIFHTPGHTPDSNTLLIGKQLYTGDTIFLPDVGTARCDFPGGSAEALYKSITSTLLSLPDSTRIYVGHDYPPATREGGALPKAHCTIAEQKRENKHLKDGTPLGDFKKWREERDAGLGQPRLMQASLQVNVRAGRLPEADKEGRRFFKTVIKALF